MAPLADPHFEAADQEEEPTMLQPIEWEAVRTFFVEETRRIAKEWFNETEEG